MTTNCIGAKTLTSPKNIDDNTKLNYISDEITDFGLAKEGVLSTLYPHTGGIGTRTYWAPEQKNSKLYNKKSDVFSLGIIWAEIWLNETMDDRQTDRQTTFLELG